MARNKKVEILSNDKEVLHPMTDGDCVIFEDGQTLAQKLSEDDSVKYTPEIVNSSPMFKVGEGNTVDYSDNVLDGAYERATLQGQTYTNYIQESSADEVTLPTPFTEYERTQHNTLTSDEEGVLGINLVGQSYVNALQHDSEEEFVVLGESLEFQEKKVEYTNEGQIKSAMLKGQTLVNLNNGERNKTLDSTSGDGKLRTYTCNIPYTIPSGTYITFKLKTNTTDGITGNLKAHFKHKANSTTNNDAYPTLRNYQTHPTGEYYVNVCYQTTIDIEALNIYLDDKTGTIDISDVMILIGDHTNEDIPYFEGMQSVTVSTRLENLCHKYNDGLAKNGKTFTTNSLSDRCIKLVDYKEGAEATYGMKPNTKYLVQFKISNLVLDGLSSLTMAFSVGELGTTNCLFKNGTKTGLITANGVYRVVLTTTDVVSTSGVEIKGIGTEWESSDSILRSLKISEVMYVEYQNGMENWNLPYFEDYQVMKPVQVESASKNLININNVTKTVLSTYTIEGNSVKITQSKEGNGGSFVAYSHYLESGQTYTYSATFSNPQGNNVYLRVSHENGNDYGQYLHDEETVTTGSQTLTFTCINSGNHFFHIYNKVYGTTINVGSVVTWANIQLEESDTATEYVPHQSKTTYSWDEVILRKIGDVEDTLDLTTGEWVQRIGEITYDGSDDEAWDRLNSHAETPSGAIIFRIKKEDMEAGLQYQKICNTILGTLPIAIYDTLYNEGVDYDCMTTVYSVGFSANAFYLHYKDITTMTEFRERLKTNPVKVQYVLTKPIVHKVNLSRPNLQVYDDITHIHTKCLDGTLIPNIYLPSDISYPAILEPGKKYNVSVNHTQVSADNPLTVNVGGTEITMTDSRMTLTTPATLANSNVSFTGKGNKIKESMLIKNSSLLTRDLPHFNGIGSVQLGKTIENLCGSDRVLVGGGTVSMTTSNDYIDVTMTKAGSCVFLFELLKVLEDGKSYFIYAPNTYPTTSQCYASFRGKTQGSLSYTNDVSKYGHEKYWILTINHKTDSPYSHLCLGQHGHISVNANFRLQKPIICEYEPGMENWDWESIGYFTGTKNIGNEFMRVQNKNFYPYGDSSFTGQQGNTWCWLNGKGCSFGASCIKKNMGNVFYLKKGSYVLSYNHNNSFQLNSIQLVGEYEKITSLNNIKQDGWYAIRVKTTTDNIPVNITNIQLEESSTTTPYTAHKHNGLYITKDQPINLTWEQGQVLVADFGDTYTSAINNTLSTRIRNKGLLNLKPNTTYRVSLGNKADYKYHIACFDNQDFAEHAITGIATGWVSSFDTIFTTTKDMHKISINVAKVGDGTITPSEINHIRLEEVTDVVLRSCSGKYDELDLTRGTYTQNVGVVYLDGVNQYSNYITVVGDTYQPTDTTLKTFDIRCDGAVVDSICLSNRLPMRESMTSTAINFESVRIHSTNTSCRLTIKKEKASTVDEFKLWLQDNPLEIIYALKTPIVHQVHIGNKNEANIEVTKPNGVFTLPTLYTEQTHIDLTNNGIIPKVQSRDYIAYPVSPMINRTYTLQHNLTGGVSNLTVDLLGRTQEITYQEPKALIYSPVTMDAILHNELRISGKGKISRIMYIDGGYMDREIPYIEGMKNACNPIVKNIGKNLISFDNVYSSYIKNGSLSCVNNTITKLKDGYNDMQLFIYLINGKHYYFGLDGSIGVGGVQQPKIVFGKMYGWKGLAEQQKVAPNQDFIYRGQTGWTTLHMVNIDYINNIYITEVQSHENCEPYKENICYVDCGEIRLTPDMFEQGSITVHVNNIGKPYTVGLNSDKARIRTKKPINIEPNEQYVIIGNTDKYGYSLHFLDKDENFIGVKAPYELSWGGHKPFTVASDSPKALVFIKRMDNGTITPNDVDAFNFQLVKVSEIKQLRSLPHGVYDEIDLETGKYIQRVGEITFNGTENWTVGYPSWGNKRTYYNNSFIDLKTFKGDNGSGQAYYDAVRCPQLHRSYMSRLAAALIDGVCSYYYSGYQRIFISKQDCATVDELKLWLQENPITVQYELPEPIVKDIVIHNYPHSYEGGHVIIENGDPNTPIPAQLTYRAVTNRSGQIQQHTEQVEKQEREINELETLILANIHLSQTR